VLIQQVQKKFLLYSPLNQGLKLNIIAPILPSSQVFTLQSIKSRIETHLSLISASHYGYVFTLQSIKSRIETLLAHLKNTIEIVFLLYSPLNQGLKLERSSLKDKKDTVFTLQSIKSRIETLGNSGRV